MPLPETSPMAREPFQTGIITGFAALGSAAVFNIASSFVLGSASAPGTSGFVLAAAVSAVAGTAAGMRSLKRAKSGTAMQELADRLAAGDFSTCIAKPDEIQTPLAKALTAIAEHQLQTDTAHARLINDAAQRQEQLFSALDSITDEVTVYDPQGILVAANKAFTRRCNSIGAVVAQGMVHQDVLNALAKASGAGLPMNERESWFKAQAEIRSESMQNNKPMRFLRFDGSPASIQAIRTAEGNQIEIVRDLSLISDLEDRTSRAEREAAAADRIKAVTLSRLSHTIRTPMTGVMTAAELMMRSDLTPVQRDRLDIIRRSAATLLGVVQDMFDLAAEAQESARSKEPETPAAPRRAILVNAVTSLEHMRPDFEADGFEVGAAESCELAVEASAQLATTSRPVDLIIVSDEAQAQFISDILAARMKEPRPQVAVANAHKDIDAKAEEKGPAAETTPQPAEQAADASAPQPDLDVLVVEDDDVNQIVYTQALGDSGYEFWIAGNGADAVEAAIRRSPRLILMDVSMPGMNGIEATRRIREATLQSAVKPVVIGMTNHFLSGDRGKCLAAGMNDYMVKPQSSDMLLANISEWLGEAPMKKAG